MPPCSDLTTMSVSCLSDFQPRGETSGALSPKGENVALHLCSSSQINLDGLNLEKHQVEKGDSISMSLYGKMSGKRNNLFLPSKSLLLDNCGNTGSP